MNATQAPVMGSDGRTWFGPAWHQQIEGIHVLSLVGSHYEMGRQHGALLKAQVPEGPIHYFRHYVEKLLRNSGLGALSPAVWAVLRQTVGRAIKRNLPDFAQDSIRGMAEGAGLPYAEVLDGCIMPDALMWIVARMIEAKRVRPAVQHRLALSLGCTSAIGWGGTTEDGRLLHARNLDYHGVESWPKGTAVFFHTPDQGHRYVSASSAGVLMGGFTAMNDQGLTLTVHQHMFTNGTRLGGTPIGVVGDRVMREASTLDEAEAILRQYKPISCWTYLIADGKTNEVMCYEENPQHVAVRRFSSDSKQPTDHFGYANIYLDPALGATERDLYPSYWRHNMGRHARAHALLKERSKTPEDMARILADDGTGNCRIRDSICMLMTVGSVVFRPQDGVLWVAKGEAPTSRNEFVPFSLKDRAHAPEAGTLRPGAGGDADRDAGFRAWRDAYIARVDRDDTATARQHLARAIALQPNQPLYQLVDGLLALEAGEHTTAEARISRALELGHPDPERIATFHMWRGRARDAQGRRDEALADYSRALAGPVDPPVRKAAEKGKKSPWKGAKKVPVDFSFADVVMP